jgi:hypothetical protein
MITKPYHTFFDLSDEIRPGYNNIKVSNRVKCIKF